MQLLSYVAADCDKKPRCKAISCKKVSRNICKQDSTLKRIPVSVLSYVDAGCDKKPHCKTLVILCI